MSLQDRLRFYQDIECLRKKPLIVYVTSSRVNSPGQMAADAVPEILAQMQALPAGTTDIDLLIASQGGDPTVAWRIVSLLRERVGRFSVLVPQAAFSAATLLALGADEIVMHPHANLGPVDPQISVRKPTNDGSSEATLRFGAEDLDALISFARESVGLRDQAQLVRVFEMVCQEVGTVPVGVASRSSQLSLSMGEKLLLTHMSGDGEKEKARGIAQALNKNYFHHGYPVGRSEARDLGLKVVNPPPDLESLMWRIWLDIESELLTRQPFSPVSILRDNPVCSSLFDPLPVLRFPAGIPVQLLQTLLPQLAAMVTVDMVPPAPFHNIVAICESLRWATRYLIRGSILAARLPDLQLRVNAVTEFSGWIDIDMPVKAGDNETEY